MDNESEYPFEWEDSDVGALPGPVDWREVAKERWKSDHAGTLIRRAVAEMVERDAAVKRTARRTGLPNGGDVALPAGATLRVDLPVLEVLTVVALEFAGQPAALEGIVCTEVRVGTLNVVGWAAGTTLATLHRCWLSREVAHPSIGVQIGVRNTTSENHRFAVTLVGIARPERSRF